MTRELERTVEETRAGSRSPLTPGVGIRRYLP